MGCTDGFVEKVVAFGICSARNPWTTSLAIVIVCFRTGITGVLTNFTMVYDHSTIFTPMSSLPTKHGKWIAEESEFVKNKRHDHDLSMLTGRMCWPYSRFSKPLQHWTPFGMPKDNVCSIR
jgi:hypothetical protein